MEKKFETADIWLCAFLSTCGLNPTLEVKQGKVLFAYPSSPDLNTLILNYQNNCTVRVLDFASAAKTLRGQMQAMKRTGVF